MWEDWKTKTISLYKILLLAALSLALYPLWDGNFFNALMSALGVFGVSLIVQSSTKQSSIGEGDIILFFLLGLWLTEPHILGVFFLAGWLGLLTHYIYRWLHKSNTNNEIPFSPAILLSFWIVRLLAS